MDFEPLHWAWQALIAAMLVVGGVFTLVGVVGMLRFPDFYMRLHAPTKATTLGVGGMLIASMVYHAVMGTLLPHELLGTHQRLKQAAADADNQQEHRHAKLDQR